MSVFRNGVLILILFCFVGTSYVSAQPTKCQMEATDGPPVLGKYIPQCTETGEYEAIQCHGSTGNCWCVNENGEELNGTRVGPGEVRPNCTVELTKCQREYKEATERQVIGNFIPQCTATGEYEMTQCHGSTGYCWCVNENGEELDGTRVGPGEAQPNCDAQLTKCQMEATDGTPVLGKYIPQCTETGEYEALQCHGSTGNCWCVNENGEELNGTRVGPGEARPNCTVELTMCQREYKEASERQVIGNYIPQCTATGEYETTQCHGSTGYCWCVNENGEELDGTRVGPGEAQPNCDDEGMGGGSASSNRPILLMLGLLLVPLYL